MLWASRIILCIMLAFALIQLLVDIGNSYYNVWGVVATLWLALSFIYSLQPNRAHQLAAWVMGTAVCTVMLCYTIDYMASGWSTLSLYDRLEGGIFTIEESKKEAARSKVAEGLAGTLVSLALAWPIVGMFRRGLRELAQLVEDTREKEPHDVDAILAAPEVKVERSQPAAEAPKA